MATSDDDELHAADLGALVELLADTPRQIVAMTADLESAQIVHRPDAESWSLNEILAHLRACQEVWGRSILAMIEQDHPTIRYVSPRGWGRKRGYEGLDFRQSLEAFTGQRASLVERLTRLDVAGWSRGATFTATVRGRNQTVLSFAHRIVDHEQEHLAQMRAVQEIVNRTGETEGRGRIDP
jgi:hypothetical protein